MLKFEDYLEQTQEVGYVDQVVHSMLRVRGLPGVRAQEVVVFENDGTGLILSLGGDVVEVLPLSKAVLKVGGRVARTGRLLETLVGENLLGRTVDPLGGVMGGDSLIGVDQMEKRLVDQDPVGILDRETISEPFEAGVVLVDLVVPLGRGQRELVVGDRKTGKSQFLLQAVLTQAQQGTICVYAGVGKRKSDIKKFEEFIKSNNIADKTLIVASTSEDAAGMIFLTPYAAMTHAEYFRDQGKNVLIILDDLTTHARFYREITLLAQRFPGRSSYPGDIFYTHARLIERAGNFKTGSITALPVAETVMGDLSGYIQTNLMAMTDGHLFFDSDLFNQGRRPPINPFLSVTRVGLQAQSPLVRDLSRQVNSFMVKQERLRQFMHFGAELSEEVKKDLDLGDRLLTFFDQPSTKIVPMPVSIIVVAALWAGWWRDITVPDMKLELIKLAQTYMTTPEYKQEVDALIANNKSFTDLVNQIKETPGLISQAKAE